MTNFSPPLEQAARKMLQRAPTVRESLILEQHLPTAEKALALVRLQVPAGARVSNADMLRAGMVVEAGLLMRGNWR